MIYTFDSTKFWEHVRGARASKRISQEQAGAELGVGGSAYSQWESDKRVLPAHRFMALCSIYDLNPANYYHLVEAPQWFQPQPSAPNKPEGEWVYRTPEELERFARIDAENDLPVGYTREQQDLYDYYRLDREMGY